MTRRERIAALAQLGQKLKEQNDYLEAVMKRSAFNNPWFTLDSQALAIQAIAGHFLDIQELEKWLDGYDVPELTQAKTVGLVMAGNIPLVGFHDFLCVFAAGHRAQIKLSEKDPYLLPSLVKMMTEFDPAVAGYVTFVERLQAFDAVIATGSNNSARYFEAYFGKYPHIIRQNRNAVAVLTGKESHAALIALGQDIFQFYGLGCRNVSKLYVPRAYDFNPLLEALHEYNSVVLNDRYKNNFDYQYTLMLLNKVEFKANGCILLTENAAIASPIACLHFEYYDDLAALNQLLQENSAAIQCVLATEAQLHLPTLPFGQAQQPTILDYADGVDTMLFLKSLEV
ncbi:MAG TPA: acyl-CoA reductase [Saprospiraceae bacterium]|nr:acyl-CoA reductase [Saprospiraceae bacterium]HMQ82671.1 acyl-CoA reductase [Saprospiraceae bacterium]